MPETGSGIFQLQKFPGHRHLKTTPAYIFIRAACRGAGKFKSRRYIKGFHTFKGQRHKRRKGSIHSAVRNMLKTAGDLLENFSQHYEEKIESSKFPGLIAY
jgi:hypothetical protein